MPSLDERLKLLRGRSRDEVGALLAASLEHAAAHEVDALARTALAAGRSAPIAAVVRNLHLLAPGTVEAVMTTGDRRGLDAAVAAVLGERRAAGDVRVAANVVGLIAARGDAGLAHHLPGLLEDAGGDESGDGRDLGEAAAEALLAVALRIVGPAGLGGRGTEDVRRLDAAIGTAAATYRRHRRPAVLCAIGLLAGRPGADVRRVLADDDHPAVLALPGLCERREQPVVRRNVIRWLGTPAIERSAARWLHTFVDGPALADLLVDGHLLVAPRRRRVLRQALRPVRCLPSAEAAAALPEPTQTWAPVLVSSLDVSSRVRRQRLAEMAALRSPVARLRALLALMEEPAGRAENRAEAFVRDPVGAVARLAAQDLLRSAGDAGDAGALERLRRSPHPEIVRRARSVLVRTNVNAFFQRWSALDDPARRAAACSLLARDRAVLIGRWAEEMWAAHGERQLGLIMLARRLGLSSRAPLAPLMLELASADDRRVASAAVADLGVSGEAGAVDILLDRIEDGPDRVRANALEALAAVHERGAPIAARLRPLLGSLAVATDNRLRANAIATLMRLDPTFGRQALRTMLADPNPLHRVSAIWVARRSRTGTLRRELQRVADADAVPEIRTRAVSALRVLGWTAPGTPRPARVPVDACA